jgi:hypothetical protein
MNRRTTLMLTGMALFGLATVVSPQPGFAQSDPFLGTWQLNIAKSKFTPWPPPRSQTLAFQAEGQNHKVVITGTNADGSPINNMITLVYDGTSHPQPGGGNGFDADADGRVDAHTVIRSRTKAGKLVATQTGTVSPDDKTLTITTTGPDANGRAVNNIAVYDKQ